MTNDKLTVTKPRTKTFDVIAILGKAPAGEPEPTRDSTPINRFIDPTNVAV